MNVFYLLDPNADALPAASTMGGVAVATLATWLLVRSLQRSSEPLPPGPPKRPFVGNIMLLDPEKGWETFHQWSKELSTTPLVSSAYPCAR